MGRSLSLILTALSDTQCTQRCLWMIDIVVSWKVIETVLTKDSKGPDTFVTPTRGSNPNDSQMLFFHTGVPILFFTLLFQ